MSATSLDLSQIKTDVLSAASTFRSLIGLGTLATQNGTITDYLLKAGGTLTGQVTGTVFAVSDSANNVPTIRTTFNTTGFGFEGQYGSAINFIHGGTRYYAATDSGFQIADSVPLRFRVLGSTIRGEIWGTSASQIDVRANSGLRVRLLDGSFAGSKINVQQWDSPEITNTYIRHDYNGMTLYGCTSPVSILDCSNQGWRVRSSISTKFRNENNAGGVIELGEVRSDRAGSLSHVSPQNNIVLYGGFAGYGIGFDGNGELGTIVNSTLRSILGQHLGLGSAGQVRFNSAADTSGSWDTQILRNATGPTLETRSAGGLRIRTLDGSAAAGLNVGMITLDNASGSPSISTFSNAGVTINGMDGNPGVVRSRDAILGTTGYLYWNARGLMTSSANGVIHVQNYDQNDTLADQALAFGPATLASNGMRLKRAMGSTTLQIRNGNDSAAGALDCGAITVNGTGIVSAFGTDPAVVQVGSRGDSAPSVNAFLGGYSAAAGNVSTVYFGQNLYFDGTNWVHPYVLGRSSLFYQQNGAFYWNTHAGNAATGIGTERMSLSNSGTLAIGGQCRIQSDAGFASISPTANRNFLLASGGVQLWNEGSFRSFLDWSTLGTVRFTDGSTGRVGIDVGAITSQYGATTNDIVAISNVGTVSGQTNAEGTKWQLVTASGADSLRLASTSFIGFNSTGNLNTGAIDASIRRNASGSTLDTWSAGGLRVRTADGSAAGPLNCGAITANRAGPQAINIVRSGLTSFGLGDKNGDSFVVYNNNTNTDLVVINATSRLVECGAITSVTNSAQPNASVRLESNPVDFSTTTQSGIGFYSSMSGIRRAGIGLDNSDEFQLQATQGSGVGTLLRMSISQARARFRSADNSAAASVECGAITASGNVALSGTFPFVSIQPSGWAGGIFYFQSGVDNNAVGSGDFTAFVNPTTRSFAWMSGNPTSTGRRHLTIDATTSNAVFGGAITASGLIHSTYRVTAAGNIFAGTGGLFFAHGTRSGIDSLADGNIVLHNNAANNFGLLQFGGTSNLFPALKRSGATLQVRLADDSAAGAIDCGAITASGVTRVNASTSGFNPALWVSGTNSTLGGAMYLEWPSGVSGRRVKMIAVDSVGLTITNMTDSGGGFIGGIPFAVSHAGNTLIGKNTDSGERLQVDGSVIATGTITAATKLLFSGTTGSDYGIINATSTRLILGRNSTSDLIMTIGLNPTAGQAGITLRRGEGIDWSGSTSSSEGGGLTAGIRSPSAGVIELTGRDVSFERLALGGVTDLFPSWKRSGTIIQSRLADDSAFASVQGKLTTETNYTAGAPTPTGYIVLYDAAGTAYKVPAEAL